jgi:purine-binding chemotaxis protein CheW
MKKNNTSYLSFCIGSEFYAANVSYVRNIIEYTPITRVPEMPDYILGVINLRGQVLPVVDARIKFGLPKTEITPKTCILDIEIENEISYIGLLVDRVSEVLEIEPDEIKAPPTMGDGIKNDSILGMYHDRGKFIMILDVAHVIATEKVVND